MGRRDWRQTLGNTFIAIGLLLLLGVGGAWGWERWQGKLLRDQLQAEPTLAVAQLPATTTPADLLAPPATATPVPSPARIPGAAAPAPQEAQTQAPTETSAPTQTPAPTQTQRPAATATQTSVPATKPVRLQIPDLKIDTPVTEMTWAVVNTADGPQSEWEIPQNAVGHAVNSALPGQPDNMVLSGHNNIYGRVLMRVSQAWPETGFTKVDAYTDESNILNGRKIEVLGADGRKFDYVITAFYRVKDAAVPLGQRLANAKYIDPTDHAQLTLTTCWPPWSNTHRLIVIAAPIS